MSDEITPFRIDIPDADVDDLRRRLRQTRWPDPETVDDWSQGIPLAYVRDLCGYWLDEYDWRASEARLNRFPQFRTEIDGADVHFVHARSPEDGALPLVMTHGWPGSIVEFHKVIEPLANPVAFGGDAADAFHVVCPSLPGYGFSGKPGQPGWDTGRIATAWDQLMTRLGYPRYAAQGGDWGAQVTTALGMRHPEHLAGIHLNMPIAFPGRDNGGELTEREQAAMATLSHYDTWESGYFKEQSTRPQTVGYGLVDSPAGLYWENNGKGFLGPVTVPVGCSIFPKEIFRPSRRWADKQLTNVQYWNELDKGGHFAAFEQPETFVSEVRACFRPLR